MTSHHDVAVACERLRRRAAFILRWNDTSSPERHKTLESEAIETAPELIEAADLLESQAKALSEAEAVCNSYAEENQRLDNRALAAEARLADLSRAMTEVRDWLILAGDMTCREIPLGIIARAFTNAAKEKT